MTGSYDTPEGHVLIGWPYRLKEGCEGCPALTSRHNAVKEAGRAILESLGEDPGILIQHGMFPRGAATMGAVVPQKAIHEGIAETYETFVSAVRGYNELASRCVAGAVEVTIREGGSRIECGVDI